MLETNNPNVVALCVSPQAILDQVFDTFIVYNVSSNFSTDGFNTLESQANAKLHIL